MTRRCRRCSTYRRSRRRARARRPRGRGLRLSSWPPSLIGACRRASGPDRDPSDTSVNRSFGAQGAVLVDLSNGHRRLPAPADGGDAGSGSTDSPGRAGRRHGQAGDQAARAAALASNGGVEGRFATVLADPAQSADGLRSAMTACSACGPCPWPARRPPPRPGRPPRRRSSSTQATDRIAAAGRLLRPADRSYQGCAAPWPPWRGTPASRLPVDHHAEHVADRRAGDQVDLVAASRPWPPSTARPQCGPGHPARSPVPDRCGHARGLVLSPTQTRGAERRPHERRHGRRAPLPSVTFTLTPLPTGTATTAKRAASVLAARSVSLAPVTFAVKPRNSYQLTVAVAVPAGQPARPARPSKRDSRSPRAPDQRGFGPVPQTPVGGRLDRSPLGS